MTDTCIQVNMLQDEKFHKHLNFITDCNITTLGLPSLSFFEALCTEVVQAELDKNLNMIGNVEDHIMMTFIKLKQVVSFRFLSMVFGWSERTVSSYFQYTILILSTLLKAAVFWPDKEAILQNLPKCFKSYKKHMLFWIVQR